MQWVLLFSTHFSKCILVILFIEEKITQSTCAVHHHGHATQQFGIAILFIDFPCAVPYFLHSLRHYLHNASEKGSWLINHNSPLSSPVASLPLYKECNRFSCHCPSGGFCAPSGWDNGSCLRGTPSTLFSPLHSPSLCQRNAKWLSVYHECIIYINTHICIQLTFVGSLVSWLPHHIAQPCPAMYLYNKHM